MAVTSLSFMHIRTLNGLLRVSRRKIRGLRRALLEEKKAKAELSAAEQVGAIDGVKKGLKQLLELYREEECDIIRVEENELKILHDEMREEAEQFKNLVKYLEEAVKIVPSVNADVYEIKKHFSDIMGKEQDEVKQIVREALDIFRDRSTRLRYATLTTNNFTSGRAFSQLTEEIKQMKTLKSEESRVEGLSKGLEATIRGKDNGNISKGVSEIRKAIEDELRDSEELIRNIHAVMHSLTIVTIHYLNAAVEHEDSSSLWRKFEELMKQGYPKDILESLERQHLSDRQVAIKDLQHIFQLARWMGYEAQAQRAQAA